MRHFILLFLFSLFLTTIGSSQVQVKQVSKLMGCRFDITVVAKDSIEAKTFIDIAENEIIRIEGLISSWDQNSQTAEINRNAGISAVKVDKELFDLIVRANKISKLTEGAFDITYASMDRVWKFDGTMKSMPNAEIVEGSVSKVGFDHLILDEKNLSVYLDTKGMKIGFGAIGKGYAADKAKALLIEKGVEAGIVNASGDMTAWGKQLNGNEWTVAITNPMNKVHAFGVLPITDQAVVTSGNYEKYVMFNGQRYAHIIDPRTGYPTTGILSVTVFAPSAELADALATSVFVLGKEIGLDLINQIPQVDCIIIDALGKMNNSNNIEINKL